MGRLTAPQRMKLISSISPVVVAVERQTPISSPWSGNKMTVQGLTSHNIGNQCCSIPLRPRELSFGFLKDTLWSSFVTRRKDQYCSLVPSDPSEVLLCTSWQKPGKKTSSCHATIHGQTLLVCALRGFWRTADKFSPFPSHSPYLAPRPNILWGPKYKMRGQHYATNTAVRICWRRAEKKFCRKGIFILLEVWQKFIDLSGDFLQNWIQGTDLTDTCCFLFIPLFDSEFNTLMWHGTHELRHNELAYLLKAVAIF